MGEKETTIDPLDNEAVDAELSRWQNAIRDKLIDLGAPDWKIDGAGCDSGDPLDFTLAEVGQGVGYFLDQIEEMRGQITTEGYWPTLLDRGDGVRGHYCIGRLINLDEPYWEYWNAGRWHSVGTVFVGRELAQSELAKIRNEMVSRSSARD